MNDMKIGAAIALLQIGGGLEQQKTATPAIHNVAMDALSEHLYLGLDDQSEPLYISMDSLSEHLYISMDSLSDSLYILMDDQNEQFYVTMKEGRQPHLSGSVAEVDAELASRLAELEEFAGLDGLDAHFPYEPFSEPSSSPAQDDDSFDELSSLDGSELVPNNAEFEQQLDLFEESQNWGDSMLDLGGAESDQKLDELEEIEESEQSSNLVTYTQTA